MLKKRILFLCFLFLCVSCNEGYENKNSLKNSSSHNISSSTLSNSSIISSTISNNYSSNSIIYQSKIVDGEKVENNELLDYLNKTGNAKQNDYITNYYTSLKGLYEKVQKDKEVNVIEGNILEDYYVAGYVSNEAINKANSRITYEDWMNERYYFNGIDNNFTLYRLALSRMIFNEDNYPISLYTYKIKDIPLNKDNDKLLFIYQIYQLNPKSNYKDEYNFVFKVDGELTDNTYNLTQINEVYSKKLIFEIDYFSKYNTAIAFNDYTLKVELDSGIEVIKQIYIDLEKYNLFFEQFKHLIVNCPETFESQIYYSFRYNEMKEILKVK